ncbi:MAG: GNAT family N-acetyltransferase [Chitinophagaceae bacterium]|nr:MAG: GNAT family N-acetyltransferase [Chitinophagaceae bacterium]
MQPQLRLITKEDDAEMGKLIKSVLTEFKANKPGTAFYDESTDHLSTVFTDAKSAYWVLEDGGKIVGGGGIYPTAGLPADTVELVKLYLSSETRGKGFGKLIINQCIEHARLLGYKNIYLETMPELNQAVSLYEKLGFEYLPKALGNTGHFGCDIWMLKKL